MKNTQAGKTAQASMPNHTPKPVVECPLNDSVVKEHFAALDEREQELLKLQKKEKDPDKLASIERRLSEIEGERKAALTMSKMGYKMAKGYSRGGAGIDQIWVKPTSVDVNSMEPTPAEIMVVEAKGGSATLSEEERYKKRTGGCCQMDYIWVVYNAIKMTSKEIDKDDPDKTRLDREQKVGETMLLAIAKDKQPPRVAGMVIQNGNPVPANDLPGTVRPNRKGEILYN